MTVVVHDGFAPQPLGFYPRTLCAKRARTHRDGDDAIDLRANEWEARRRRTLASGRGQRRGLRECHGGCRHETYTCLLQENATVHRRRLSRCGWYVGK